ncbi:MAG TPA: protealysin inhibitor emfourin, partial [Chroococcales cyanobacterium]
GMRLTKVVDASTLPPEEKNQLRRLVDAADFFRLPATLISTGPQPDRFQYRLTLEEDTQQHTVLVSEQAVPGTLRPLIEWLMQMARQG